MMPLSEYQSYYNIPFVYLSFNKILVDRNEILFKVAFSTVDSTQKVELLVPKFSFPLPSAPFDQVKHLLINLTLTNI